MECCYHGGLGLKLYISYMWKSILHGVTETPLPLAMLGDESQSFCCFLISGARAWLNYARSLTHNDKDVTRGCFLLYTGYYHNLAAHTGRIRGRTVDSAKENFLGHWYVTSSPVSSRVFTHIGVGSNSGQKDVFCHWAKGQKDNSDTGNRTRALPALRC
jgi:hypothetical protein